MAHDQQQEHVVLFVCLHGMGMSRLAAAFFNSSAPAGWPAVSAGIEPGDTLSPTAARLLAGTPAEPFLDHDVPRSIDSVPLAERVIAIRNPAIRFELPEAETWDLLRTEFNGQMCDEIRTRSQRLAEQVGHR